MDAVMHSNQDVKKALDNFILVSIDVDKQPEIAKKFGAPPLPLMLFFTPDGEQKEKKLGGLKAESLLKVLNKNK